MQGGEGMKRILATVMFLAACGKAAPPAHTVGQSAYCHDDHWCFRSAPDCLADNSGQACKAIENAWVIRWLDQSGHSAERVIPSMADCEPLEKALKEGGLTFTGCTPL